MIYVKCNDDAESRENGTQEEIMRGGLERGFVGKIGKYRS